jgi:tRNA threonylcarbamoyladenosine biosynthesis protein TsaB
MAGVGVEMVDKLARDDDYYPVMLVLALDTTTSSSSCAVTRDGVVVYELVNETPGAHAGHLPRDLMSVLERAGLRLADVHAFAVATGPGSFTGLRIGIATMQGLAFAEGKPLIGISGFDALAHRAAATTRVATWVDAWRGEVFAALYDGGREVETPVVCKPERLLDTMRGQPTLFIGDGAAAHRGVIEQMMGDAARVADPVSPPLAGAIGMLAHAAGAHGVNPPDAIRPLYVRRTDVELARDARSLQ